MNTVARRLALLCALAVATPAAATLIVPVSDGHLAETSTAAVTARVLSVGSSPGTERPATDYLIEVDRLVAGEVSGRHLILRLPGGERPDGTGLALEGVPRFTVGERLFLFLDPGADGTYHPRHLMQGVFREVTGGGRRVLVRDAAVARELTAPATPEASRERYYQPRDAEAFERWVAERARGADADADYFLAPADGDGAATPGSVRGDYRVFRDDDSGLAMRWFDFDAGNDVSWRIRSGGQPGFGESQTASALKAAMAAWNNAKGTNIRYRYAGATGSPSGNLVLFDDEDDSIDTPFDCGRGGGGTLAVGGPSYTFPSPGPGGTSFHRIVRAGVTTNENIECYLESVPDSLAQLLAHELGHTLGIHHPCDVDGGNRPCTQASSLETDALMYPYLHADGRGARINEDDRAAARALYPGNTNPVSPPAVPSALTAQAVSATTVLLAWSDNADDETGYRIEARPAGGAFTTVANVPADSESTSVGALQPATLYTFRVQARNSSGGSPYSNQASATTPDDVPAAPTGLVATPVSATSVRLTWEPAPAGVDLFVAEVQVPGAEGTFAGGAAGGDATELVVHGLETGVPATFRLRATNGQGDSDPSNAASATPFAAGTPCAASPDALCLQGRFRVTTHWNDPYNGGSGTGGAVPFAGGQSGTFWFFQPDNVELIVKLLDGNPVNQHFWAFHGSLTDVEYWISVLDTADGSSRTYHNPPFDRCGEFDTAALPGGAAGAGVAAAAAVAAPASTGEDAVLALHEGRFEVRVEWINQRVAGDAGIGRRIDGTPQTGYFWFFDPANVELVVKVLDAREVNDRFWVFFGSLSDVEYTVTVTDNVTGQSRTYHNAPGSQCGQFDTAAFPFPA